MFNEDELKELYEACGGFSIMTKEEEFIADHSEEIAQEYAWMIEERSKNEIKKPQTKVVKVDFSFGNNKSTCFVEVDKYWDKRKIMDYIKKDLRIEIDVNSWLYQF